MKISIIIPTYKGTNKILNIIQSLEKQTIQNFETIIMIDGSPDNTEEVIKSYSHSLQNLRIINQANQGRAKVRNDGARLATGDLLIFFDDDMHLKKNCIEEHIKFHNVNANIILVGGINENAEIMTTDIQKYKAFLSDKWIQEIKAWKKALIKNNLYLTAANFSIPKILFNQLNGFDERLNDAEDYDLAVRAFQENIPIYYHHEAFAWHDDFITCQSYIKRQKEYRSFHQKLLALKPELYQKFNERQAPLPTGIKAIIFQLFSFNFWVWSIDNFNWLIILPKKIRYKIYDLVITSHFLYK